MLSACSQGRLAPLPARCWPGRLSCCRPASGSLRRATRSWTILGAIASARTLATAHHAHPEHIHAQPSHYRSPLLTVLFFRALSQCLPSEMGASSGSGSDDRACVYMCVRVGVHCRQLEPAVLPEKTALNLVENSANASQNAIFFWRCAAPTLGGTPRKKVEIPRQKVRSREFDIFLRKKWM